jgi:hypothetical protein
MANFAGLEIETPQEVLARLAQARQQAMAQAQTPEENTQIIINRALDLVMGNPEVEAARRKSAAVGNAIRSAQEFGKEAGLSEQDIRLKELTNIRDSLLEVDPGQALKVTQMIQQQEVANLERRKLKQQLAAGDLDLAQANKRYVLNPDTLKSEELDISTLEGAQRLLAARQRGEAIAANEGGLLNLYNAERARQHDAEMKEATSRAKKEQELLAKAGETQLLGKETANALKKGLPAIRQPLDQLERAASLLNDPRYLDISGKVGNFAAKAADLVAGGLLSEEEAKWYDEVIRVRANIANASGEFLHERYGGALTTGEAERAKQYLPDKDDTPEEFLTKTEELYMMLTTSMRRATTALSANRWDVLTQPGTEFWDEETDRLFDPAMRRSRVTKTAEPEETLRFRKQRGQQRPKGKFEGWSHE